MEIQFLEQNYDIAKCSIWMKKVTEIQNKCRTLIADKIVQRFEVVKVPRNMTINDLAVDLIINLSLTCGTGFYSSKVHETIWKGRKLVLKDKETGEFYDGGNADQKETVRQMLGLQEEQVVEISGDHPKYEVQLKFDLHDELGNWCHQRLVAFFNSDKDFIKSKEHGSGNTALHMACRHGHFDIVLFLLENGADIDMFNNHNNTPFFLATESLQKEICQLLIEWGAEVMKRNKSSKTAFELMRHYELKKFLQGKYRDWQELVPTLISGDIKKLTEVVDRHHRRENMLASLRSRCVSGSTLLHTASFFGAVPVIKTLLSEGLDVNILDYKGATPLHRARDGATVEVMQLAISEFASRM
ncbi:PREDICTED: tankyrase-2-like [Acropora digitifera]|uniref:tankyrase-2-like n=1 Tax=Acropora digitifera TaxID=70779 RepID=UPI00077B0039|nr:PREDICTED: tankyrase-2-like [Acropora digitifera]